MDQAYYREARAVNETITENRELLVKSLIPDETVLDIACGSGENSKFIGTRNYLGFDISTIGLKMARDYKNAILFQADVSDIPLRDSGFSNIICTHSLEHFTRVERAFGEIWRVLAKGGVLVLVHPNYGDYFFLIPPSLKRKGLGVKMKYIAEQVLRLAYLVLGFRKYSFPVISNPDILDPDTKFESDNDLTYPASSREIMNYFKAMGAREISLNYYKPVFKRPLLKHLKTNLGSILRTAYYSIPLFKYQPCGLIVVKK